MKIIIPGGSGQVGTILARAFHADGHEGFEFEFLDWKSAAQNLCQRWRSENK